MRQVPRAALSVGLLWIAVGHALPSVCHAGIYSAEVLADRPVAYFRLEESGGDRSTNLGWGDRLHGRYFNYAPGELGQASAQGPALPGFGATNHAPVFDGTDNRSETADNATVGDVIDITGPLTLEAWVLHDSSTPTTNEGIAAKYRGSDNSRAYNLYLNPSLELGMVISPSGQFSDARVLESDTPLSADQWYHVAATFVPGHSMKLYVDGAMVQETTTDVPAAIHVNNAPLWIGAQFATGPGEHFAGRIDEVAVYDRALSAERIAAHHAAATTPAFQPDQIPGLKTWYQIDDGTQVRFDGGLPGYRVDRWQDSGPGVADMQQSGGASPLLLQDQLAGFPAVDFDGSNDFLSAGNVKIHDNAQGLTVAAVVRPENTADAQWIVSKYDSSSGRREWGLSTQVFSVQDSAGSFDPDTVAAFAMTADEWHLIVGVWMPGEAARVYLDGRLAGTAAQAVADLADTDASLLLGATNEGAWQNLDGQIAEVLLFDHALGEAEHLALGAYLDLKYGLQTAYVPEPATFGSSALAGLLLAALVGLRSTRPGRKRQT